MNIIIIVTVIILILIMVFCLCKNFLMKGSAATCSIIVDENKNLMVRNYIDKESLINFLSDSQVTTPDLFYKRCYIRAILSMLTEGIDIKGFTLDESYGNLTCEQENNCKDIELKKFQTRNNLRSKILNVTKGIYSFEWNEGNEKHLWKNVLTDITNVLSIMFQKVVIEVILNFNESYNNFIKLNVNIVDDWELNDKISIEGIDYHSFNITYLNKSHLQNSDTKKRRNSKDSDKKPRKSNVLNKKIKFYGCSDLEFETIEFIKNYIKNFYENGININNINRKIDANKLGKIYPNSISSIKEIIYNSIEQKIDIFKKFDNVATGSIQTLAKNMLYTAGGTDYGIRRGECFPLGKKNAYLHNDEYHVLININHEHNYCYDANFKITLSDNEDNAKGFCQNPDGLLFI